jgi:Arc/MetJ family transcription regulator
VVCVSRTNIDIDDSVLEQVMRTYDLRTKKEAVDYALRRLLVVPMTKEQALAMQGSGYDFDNDELEGEPTVVEL